MTHSLMSLDVMVAVLNIVMLSVIMLTFIMLSVIMLTFIMLSVVIIKYTILYTNIGVSDETVLCLYTKLSLLYLLKEFVPF
jgi:hypothetical protein